MNQSHEDIYTINAVDKDGKPFDKVSRIFCKGEGTQMELILDVHTASYVVEQDQKFRFTLLKSLYGNNMHMDDNNYDNNDDIDDGNEMTEYSEEMEDEALSDCDYCMFGMIFKIIPDKDRQYSIYVSFGGLLMMLKGPEESLLGFKVGKNIYMKMKRVAY